MNKISLNTQILIAALFGLILGFFLQQIAPNENQQSVTIYPQVLYVLTFISSVFIGLLKMLLVPLIFCSIVVGVANLRASKQMGKVWKITLMCSVVTTSIALIMGLTAAHFFNSGQGVDVGLLQQAMSGYQQPEVSLDSSSLVQNFVKNTLINPFSAMAEGNVLAVVVFALLVGSAIVAGGEKFKAIHQLMQQGFDLTMLLVQWVMKIAPLGIFALLAKLLATEDFSVLSSLAKFAAVVTGTTIFHGLIVLPLLLWFFGRLSPLRFFSAARVALLTAFATSSSAATLPMSLKATEKMGVNQAVSGFVVPLGAQLNMDGTALYEAAAALFIANLVGIDLTLTDQLIVCLTAMIASLGAPGIPSAGMVTMIMVLQSVGLPAEAIVLLLPMDRLLDTVRTVVNVEGDMAISVVVQRFVKADQVPPEITPSGLNQDLSQT